MVTFSSQFSTVVSTYATVKVVSNHSDISSATTTNIDITLGKACDVMGIDIEWTARVAADYISGIKVMDNGSTVKHILFSGTKHTPYMQSMSLYALQPLFKGALSTDKIRVTFVSTATTAQTVNVDVQIAQDVQTS